MREKITTKLEAETRERLRKIASDNGMKYENQAIEFLVNKWYEGEDKDGLGYSK